MGLLSEGQPLSWEETKALADHVRKHGVQQFIHLWRKLETRKGDVLKWGDEVEYVLVKMDEKTKSAKLLLTADDFLDKLQEPEKRGEPNLQSLWRPEYAAYMIEGTPGGPYGGGIGEFNKVQRNMEKRRREVQELLGPDEKIFSITAYPRMGCDDFTVPFSSPDAENSVTRSLFWPDSAIFNGHPRFKTLTRNIRQRRMEKVDINIPIYQDENTKDPHQTLIDKFGIEAAKASKPGHIYMDAMGFGMGMSCLQLTFQACHVQEAVRLYDQLATMCPIMLALTASNPILRGYLAGTDCRWDIIAASVDCRTREERGLEKIAAQSSGSEAKFGPINKSRYGSISSYLSDCSLTSNYNDIPLVHDEETYKILKDAGINDLMAKHVAHLFIRDTVSLFSEKVHQDDEKETDHFENIQSTNWQTMRFKPPPVDSEIGWRVEFRPCELQMTDFENAAVACFVVLLTRVILSYGYNLLVPISKVDENMKRAQRMDAVKEEKFYFRTNITTTCTEVNTEPTIKEMTIDEIMNGSSAKNFPGLVPLVQDYLRNIEVDTDTMCTLSRYLIYIQRKSQCQMMTNARFIRNFVQSHPEYQKDSVISERMSYDLLTLIDRIEKGEIPLCDALSTGPKK